MTDEFWMQRALALAHTGAERGEVPVGAVIVGADGRVLGEGFNQPIGSVDPTAHAEIVALRAASIFAGNYRLPGATIYVTLEPCLMCAGALIHARVERLVYAAAEPKAGAVVSGFHVLEASCVNHRIAVESGLLAEASSQLLSGFFATRRATGNRDLTGSVTA